MFGNQTSDIEQEASGKPQGRARGGRASGCARSEVRALVGHVYACRTQLPRSKEKQDKAPLPCSVLEPLAPGTAPISENSGYGQKVALAAPWEAGQSHLGSPPPNSSNAPCSAPHDITFMMVTSSCTSGHGDTLHVTFESEHPHL